MPQTAEHNTARAHTKCGLICILFVLSFLPQKTFAVDACVSNDARALILDSNTTYGSYDYNSSAGTWTVTGSNRTIRGAAACVNYGVPQPNCADCCAYSNYSLPYTLNNGVFIENNQLVVGGEKNGPICWCKITYPVVSLWVHYKTYCSVSACVSDCTTACSSGVYTWPWFRKALFNTVQ